jgi:hypothetical protein
MHYTTMSSSQSPWEKLISSGFPIRILAVVYPTSPLFAKTNTGAVEDKVMQELHIEKQHTKHIVSEMWPTRTVMVFDYRHDDYDFANGHNCEQLKTIAVHFRAAQNVRVGIAEGASNEKINKEVAELHRLNGDKKPPFVADHTENQVPEYHNPRDMTQKPSLEL